jgi:hypothetical protein
VLYVIGLLAVVAAHKNKEFYYYYYYYYCCCCCCFVFPGLPRIQLKKIKIGGGPRDSVEIRSSSWSAKVCTGLLYVFSQTEGTKGAVSANPALSQSTERRNF